MKWYIKALLLISIKTAFAADFEIVTSRQFEQIKRKIPNIEKIELTSGNLDIINQNLEEKIAKIYYMKARTFTVTHLHHAFEQSISTYLNNFKRGNYKHEYDKFYLIIEKGVDEIKQLRVAIDLSYLILKQIEYILFIHTIFYFFETPRLKKELTDVIDKNELTFEEKITLINYWKHANLTTLGYQRLITILELLKTNTIDAKALLNKNDYLYFLSYVKTHNIPNRVDLETPTGYLKFLGWYAKTLFKSTGRRLSERFKLYFSKNNH
jgi:hypothetical protein